MDAYTSKLLNRTLPFDENKAILFIRGKHQELLGNGTATDRSHDEATAPIQLNGEDIREFYDHVIQTTPSSTIHQSEPHKPIVTKETIKSKCRSKRVTVSEMFRFVQEGDLDNLHDGLTTGEHDINMRDSYGWSLLMCTSCAGHMTVALYLLNNGVEWRGVVDRCGVDAPGLAERAGNIELAQLIRSFELNREEEVPLLEPSETNSFYCDTCKMEVSGSTNPHSVSTLHQFSCKHQDNLSAYSLPVRNKGFQMMLQSGWNPKIGLGSCGQGHQYPIKTVLKRDRYGLGIPSQKRAKVTHFAPGDVSAVRNHRWRTKKQSLYTTMKEREKVLQKEKRWEVDLRLYMNS